MHTEETKARISESLKGRKPWTTGKHLPESTKRKISESLRGHSVDPNTRKKISQSISRKIPELSQKLKDAWSNPVSRMSRLEVMESYDYKSKISKSSKEMWSNPEFKKSMSGENSPMWMGGVSFEPYCKKFNSDLKNRVRLFFNNRCILCGDSPTGYKLSVHHVNYNKNTCCDDTKPVFATLCRKCHALTSTRNKEQRQSYEDTISKIITETYGGRCYLSVEEYAGATNDTTA